MHSRHTSEDNFICPCNPVNHHVILHKSPFYYSLLAYNSYCLNICLDFTRFQPLVKFWGPFPMCLAPCAWMQEACTLLFNVSRLSASSKCFCLLTTCLPCDGDAALTHWVSWAKCWLGALRSIIACGAYFTFFMLSGDTASNLGSAVDELMRHQPTLKQDATTAIIKASWRHRV